MDITYLAGWFASVAPSVVPGRTGWTGRSRSWRAQAVAAAISARD